MTPLEKEIVHTYSISDSVLSTCKTYDDFERIAVSRALTRLVSEEICRAWMYGGSYGMPVVDPPSVHRGRPTIRPPSVLLRYAPVVVGTTPFLEWIRAVWQESNDGQQVWWENVALKDESYEYNNKDRLYYEKTLFKDIIQQQPRGHIYTLYRMLFPEWYKERRYVRVLKRFHRNHVSPRTHRPPTGTLPLPPTRAGLVAYLATAGRSFAHAYWDEGLPLFFPGLDLGPNPFM